MLRRALHTEYPKPTRDQRNAFAEMHILRVRVSEWETYVVYLTSFTFLDFLILRLVLGWAWFLVFFCFCTDSRHPATAQSSLGGFLPPSNVYYYNLFVPLPLAFQTFVSPDHQPVCTSIWSLMRACGGTFWPMSEKVSHVVLRKV